MFFCNSMRDARQSGKSKNWAQLVIHSWLQDRYNSRASKTCEADAPRKDVFLPLCNEEEEAEGETKGCRAACTHFINIKNLVLNNVQPVSYTIRTLPSLLALPFSVHNNNNQPIDRLMNINWYLLFPASVFFIYSLLSPSLCSIVRVVFDVQRVKWIITTNNAADMEILSKLHWKLQLYLDVGILIFFASFRLNSQLEW